MCNFSALTVKSVCHHFVLDNLQKVAEFRGPSTFQESSLPLHGWCTSPAGQRCSTAMPLKVCCQQRCNEIWRISAVLQCCADDSLLSKRTLYPENPPHPDRNNTTLHAQALAPLSLVFFVFLSLFCFFILFFLSLFLFLFLFLSLSLSLSISLSLCLCVSLSLSLSLSGWLSGSLPLSLRANCPWHDRTAAVSKAYKKLSAHCSCLWWGCSWFWERLAAAIEHEWVCKDLCDYLMHSDTGPITGNNGRIIEGLFWNNQIANC